MPVDVALEFRDGRTAYYHLPLSLMRGEKPSAGDRYTFTTLPAWQWTNTQYTITVPGTLAKLVSVTIDPLQRTADTDRSNDRVELPEGAGGMIRP
jgi:hypothetical protein